MIGRRGFLSLLSAAGAATLLPKTFVLEPEKLWTPSPNPVTLEAMTAEVMRSMKRALGGLETHNLSQWGNPAIVDGAALRLGDTVAYYQSAPGLRFADIARREVMLDQYRTVCVQLYPEREMTSEKYLVPMGESLAHAVKTHGIKYFGKPGGTGEGVQMVTISDDALSLRGVSLYDITDETVHLRFDILGAAAA